MQDDLQLRYSPEQIVGRLRREFPDDPEMRVSAETIYQSLSSMVPGWLQRLGADRGRPGVNAGQNAPGSRQRTFASSL